MLTWKLKKKLLTQGNIVIDRCGHVHYGCYGYSVKDLVVSNPVPGAAVPKIVHKIEEEKDMINLQVRNEVMYMYMYIRIISKWVYVRVYTPV